jgi:hypothetical protein
MEKEFEVKAFKWGEDPNPFKAKFRDFLIKST